MYNKWNHFINLLGSRVPYLKFIMTSMRKEFIVIVTNLIIERKLTNFEFVYAL